MAKEKKEEACSTKGCCGCKTCGWIIPIAIIILIWVWPAALWSQIVITVLAALGLLGHLCPCRKQ